jgi:hypothetical protein
MMEDTKGAFRVEVYGPDDKLIAQSPKGIGVERALGFVREIVEQRHLTAHFHWEECPTKAAPATTVPVATAASTVESACLINTLIT